MPLLRMQATISALGAGVVPPAEGNECASTPVPGGDRWWHWIAGICAPFLTPHPDPVAKRPLVLRDVPVHLPGGGPQKGGTPSRWRALATPAPRPRRRFLQQDVTWVDLDALAREPNLDPQLAMLTLPIQKEPNLALCAQRILELRPDLIELIVPILSERFQGLSHSQIMATLGISKEFWRHTRAFQDILAEGREEGREEGRRREASTLALRQLERRCGSLEAPTTARIEALNLSQLEELALALLDFRSAQDLQAWLEPMEARGARCQLRHWTSSSRYCWSL